MGRGGHHSHSLPGDSGLLNSAIIFEPRARACQKRGSHWKTRQSREEAKNTCAGFSQQLAWISISCKLGRADHVFNKTHVPCNKSAILAFFPEFTMPDRVRSTRPAFGSRNTIHCFSLRCYLVFWGKTALNNSLPPVHCTSAAHRVFV